MRNRIDDQCAPSVVRGELPTRPRGLEVLFGLAVRWRASTPSTDFLALLVNERQDLPSRWTVGCRPCSAGKEIYPMPEQSQRKRFKKLFACDDTTTALSAIFLEFSGLIP